MKLFRGTTKARATQNHTDNKKREPRGQGRGRELFLALAGAEDRAATEVEPRPRGV